MDVSKIRIGLAVAVILSILIIVSFMGFGTIDQEECGVISVIAGVLVRELQTITAYYFPNKNNYSQNLNPPSESHQSS